VIATCEETAATRLFPDRKLGARGSPRVEDLVVVPRTVADPLDEIQDERFDGVGHVVLTPPNGWELSCEPADCRWEAC
jgi:hypothetical protein